MHQMIDRGANAWLVPSKRVAHTLPERWRVANVIRRKIKNYSFCTYLDLALQSIARLARIYSRRIPTHLPTLKTMTAAARWDRQHEHLTSDPERARTIMPTTPIDSISSTATNSDDPDLEQLEPTKQLKIRSTRPGKNVHPSTVSRWILKGVKTPDGRRVKLRAVRLGWAWYTTRAWLDEFITASTPETAAPVATASRTLAERSRAAAQARKQLAQLGVGA